MTILLDEYFQDSITNYAFEPTMEERVRCLDLLERVGRMVEDFCNDTGLPEPEQNSGHRCRAKTLAMIAQGYRAAVGGQHEQSNAIDLHDHGEHLESWLTDAKLETYGLYRESPAATLNWVHVQRVPPGSYARTFNP